jgi:hypothetical protein
MLDITKLSTQTENAEDARSGNYIINLVEDFEKLSTGSHTFYVDTSNYMPGHHLIGINSRMPFHSVGKRIVPSNKIFKIGMFIPSTGFGHIDDFGRFGLSWALQDPQVEFLIGVLDHWEEMGKPTIVIDFFDESPNLRECVIQLYDLFRLYGVHVKHLKLVGHNFEGQPYINALAKELGELPIEYIVEWDMHGHLNTEEVERFNNPDYDRGKPLQYVDKNDWDTIRPNSVTFLNRRPDAARTTLAWLLYKEDYARYDTVTSMYPPLLYHMKGVQDPSQNPKNWITKGFIEGELYKHGFECYIDVTDEDVDDFKEKFRVGESLEDDFDYIGGAESKYIPYNNSSYVWLACETTALMRDNTFNTFITEKTLKPMYTGQALVVFGSPFFISKVKHLGFHTLAEEFEIDESYDSMANPVERATAISKEIKKLLVTPPEELHRRWLLAKDKIIENQIRILSMMSQMTDNFFHHKNQYVFDKMMKDPEHYNADELLKFRTRDVLELYKNFSNINFLNDN